MYIYIYIYIYISPPGEPRLGKLDLAGKTSGIYIASNRLSRFPTWQQPVTCESVMNASCHTSMSHVTYQ